MYSLLAQWRNAYRGLPRTIWFLAFVNLVNRCGGMVVAFLTLYMTEQLGFDVRQTGYAMGAFGAGSVAGSYLGGRLTNRFGYYPVQWWSLVLAGVVLIGLLWVHDFYSMCLAIFLLSMVADAFRPANSVAMAVHSTPDNRTRSISLMRMAFNLGWSIAPALGGIIAHSLGWNWLFWIDGVTCILAAILLRILVKPIHKSDSTAPQPTEIDATVTTKSAQSPYRNGRILAFTAFTFLSGLVFMQMIWTVPLFLKNAYGWNESLIGVIIALNGVVVFLVEMPLIFRLEASRPPLQFVRLGIVLYAVSYACFLFPGIMGMTAALLFIVFISFGEIFVMPFSSNYIFAHALRSARSGDYMGLYGMAYAVANILAPLLGTQIIAASGYAALWWLAIGVSGLAWLGFWWLDRENSRSGS